MTRNVELGRKYVVRSQISGKAREVEAVEIRSNRVLIVYGDNDKTGIVTRWRLHNPSSLVLTDQETFEPTAELSAMLDKLLGG
jgi:LEA14-like dessication related protein